MRFNLQFIASGTLDKQQLVKLGGLCLHAAGPCERKTFKLFSSNQAMATCMSQHMTMTMTKDQESMLMGLPGVCFKDERALLGS